MQRADEQRVYALPCAQQQEEPSDSATCDARIEQPHDGERRITNDEEHELHHDQLTMVPAADYECRKRKRQSPAVDNDQCAFLRLWCKFIAMFNIHRDDRLEYLAAPLLVLCMRVMSPFCSWTMSICTEIRHTYGIDLNPANPVDAALLLVHTVAAAKADQINSDLYTVRNTEFQCCFPLGRGETSYTGECVGSSAMLFFLCGCMAALHAYNVHKRFLLGAFRNTDPSHPLARCPRKRQEAVCFYWLQYELQKIPATAHLEIVNIITNFWKDNIPDDRHNLMFSSVREFLMQNEVFLTYRAVDAGDTAEAGSSSSSICQAEAANRQEIAESKEEARITPPSMAFACPGTSARRRDITAAPSTVTGDVHVEEAGHSVQAAPNPCPLARMAANLRMCRRELVEYIIRRGTQLCTGLSGFHQTAIERLASQRSCTRFCVARVPQLRGDPNDIMYLDSSGQFAVRPAAPSEDIGCPIS